MKQDVERLYEVIDTLRAKNGVWSLETWPPKSAENNDGTWKKVNGGVYFFFEDGEKRRTGADRVVRVGTHGVDRRSTATLEDRLQRHRCGEYGKNGLYSSVFFCLIASALYNKDEMNNNSKYKLNSITDQNAWNTENYVDESDKTNKADQNKIQKYQSLTSDYLKKHMTFTFIQVECEASSTNDRAVIERGAIALLSNINRSDSGCDDQPSVGWLGRRAVTAPGHFRGTIQDSGLWNSHYVKNEPSPEDIARLFATLERHAPR